MDGDSEDDKYTPLSEDEVSLGDEEFIVAEDPVELTLEKDDREDGQVSPDEQAANEVSPDEQDSNYLPLSEDEVSLGDEDFIVPEEPLEQERFKRRVIATARSLKKKQ